MHTHTLKVNIENNFQFERVWCAAEVMSLECPSSTSKDKPLTLSGREHRGRRAVDHGGSFIHPDLHGCSTFAATEAQNEVWMGTG